MGELNNIEIRTLLIPLMPLLGFLVLGLGRQRLSKRATSIIASLSVLLSFGLAISLFGYLEHHEFLEFTLFPFLKLGDEWIGFSLLLDHLNIIYLLVITGVGALIHIYSGAYMSHETSEGYARYFAYLNLFVFSMLMLVMGSNYVITFIGWEGVGLCSYLLIGFWYKNIDYTKAAQKAFVMNRIGDLGLLVGMYMLYTHTGTLSYHGVQDALQASADKSWFDIAAICLLLGATGKSAQIPLFTWLPDAMAGPTPVSALIHAATMVTAGIFLVCRSFPLFDGAPDVQNLMMWIGVATAVVAATIATQQNDIKKVLAYSTVSQLGFMFVALGVGAYTAAVFHVVTHAFFKALLFLGAGSVIHAMSDEQDMQYMGGLSKKLPITRITFLIGCLAIAGIPLFSGFFSKDEILLHTFIHNKTAWAIMAIAALLTAYYMFRAYYLTFTGDFRGTEEQAEHLHESPTAMTLPLIILAVLATVGGALNVPAILGGDHWLHNYICSAISDLVEPSISHDTEWMLMGLAVALSIVGILWGRGVASKLQFAPTTSIGRFFRDKWYVDEFYQNLFVRPIGGLAHFLNTGLDSWLDKLVNGTGALVPLLSRRLLRIQNGKLGGYLFVMVIGIIILFVVIYFTMILKLGA